MASLTELANKYGTDKGTFGPSVQWQVHNYTDIYEAYLGHLRNEPIRVLEVGLGISGDAWTAGVAHGRNSEGGASMKMWYDYFPNASIFGADINPAEFLENDRTKIFRLDQGNFAQLTEFGAEVGGDFDVIIDDGSHRADHQQITFAALFPFLKPGGLYFIEDLMRNGVGDNDKGRFSADHDVVSTRTLFTKFAAERQFPEPNDLTDAASLADQIASVVLHVPGIRVSAEFSLVVNSARPRSGRLITEYLPDSAKLCAVRKKA